MNWLRMWLRRIALGCAIFLPAGSLLALDPAKSIYQYNCQNWTRQNGLPADVITGVTQTKDGYIWFGTQKGMVRFDGMEFKLVTITLPGSQNQTIKSVCRAKDGGLWLSIGLDLFGLYDGRRFSPIDDQRWAGTSTESTFVFEASDGAVWTGSAQGLGRWVKGKPQESFFDENYRSHIMCFAEGARGRVWVGTVEQGLLCWQRGKLSAFPDESLKKDNIFAVTESSNGQIWVGTGNGLHCYDPNFLPIQLPNFYNEVNSILVDRHGMVWVGTPGAGLARYKNGEFTWLKKTDGLVSDAVSALYEDSEGSLWVGTRNGLSQITDVKFPIYSDREGLPSSSVVSVSARHEGGLWITTEKGLSCFDGQRLVDFTNNAALRQQWFKRVFQASNGDLYITDDQKRLLKVSGGKVAATYTNQNWPTGMVEDGKSFVVAVGGSLFRIQDGKMSPFAYGDGKEPIYYWIFNICRGRDGAVWIASNNGIFRIINGVARHWSTGEGLSDNNVSCIFEDADGVIWAGLDSGIARIKDGQIKNITSKQGLADDNIYEIVPDALGNFWMDSIAGILRASRKSLNDVADGKTDHVTCQLFDGLESIKFTGHTKREPVAARTPDGRIWFPNPQGLAMIDPAHFFTNSVVPPVYIEQIRINGAEVQDRKALSLPVGGGRMEFHFAVLSYIAPQKAKLRYQLEGFDTDWIDAEGRRSVLYNSLRPGRYCFRVQGCNADGVWNTAGDSFAVELPPAFYQTAWFLGLCVLVGLAGLGLIYRWMLYRAESKQRRLKEANDLLELKVRERTAELAKANEKMEQTHQQLMVVSRQAGMAEVATGVLHNVGNVLNSVNVSANLVVDGIRSSRAASLGKVVDLLEKHREDLAQFLTQDEKGKQLRAFLSGLNEHLAGERTGLLEELKSLTANIEHIKEIVAMQQANAHRFGVMERAEAAELMESALKMNEAAYGRHNVQLVRDYEEVPALMVDKHKVLQILINLLQNAKRACVQSGRAERRVTVRIRRQGEGAIRMEVADNGVGIPAENLTRIFAHGFTTKADGHGFGLHSGALAARQLGGALRAESEGVGKGATFTLELPLDSGPRLEEVRHAPANGTTEAESRPAKGAILPPIGLPGQRAVRQNIPPVSEFN